MRVRAVWSVWPEECTSKVWVVSPSEVAVFADHEPPSKLEGICVATQIEDLE